MRSYLLPHSFLIFSPVNNPSHRVNSSGLNLRSSYQVAPNNVLGVLPQGQLLQLLPPAERQPGDWAHVRTELQGKQVEGFVAARYLQPLAEPSQPVRPVVPVAPIPTSRLPKASIPRAGVPRSSPDWRAFSLSEAGQPGRPGPTPAEHVQQLGRIVAHLAVEDSARYKPEHGKTYCNIYAHDYAHLAGAYLPRVWWTPEALTELASGKEVQARYGTTVAEITANNLYHWFAKHGAAFGWREVTDLNVLQQAANAGKVCIVVGQNKMLRLSGHICAVVPETPQHQATRVGGKVTAPLTSQAGAKNWLHQASYWWEGNTIGAHSFWMHD